MRLKACNSFQEITLVTKTEQRLSHLRYKANVLAIDCSQIINFNWSLTGFSLVRIIGSSSSNLSFAGHPSNSLSSSQEVIAPLLIPNAVYILMLTGSLSFSFSPPSAFSFLFIKSLTGSVCEQIETILDFHNKVESKSLVMWVYVPVVTMILGSFVAVP